VSKITNDGLTRSGTGWFTDGNSGRQRVNTDCTLYLQRRNSRQLFV